MSDPCVPRIGGVLSADIAVPEHEREVRFAMTSKELHVTARSGLYAMTAVLMTLVMSIQAAAQTVPCMTRRRTSRASPGPYSFPGAGHGIRMREGHGGGGRAPFAHGYAEVQLGWLWRHMIAGATAEGP